MGYQNCLPAPAPDNVELKDVTHFHICVYTRAREEQHHLHVELTEGLFTVAGDLGNKEGLCLFKDYRHDTDECVRITDTGLGFLSTMTSLTALYLRWCCQVQDFGLQHIYSMKKLRVLSLAGCPLLTPAGLSGLVQLKNLEELELTNCPGTTPELFQYYAQHLPHCMVIE
ncbi:F-box/LRR-repeat protein 16 [Branchiostoma belcheri]|nr:F-box/LRR-repeat protein 16 [Branchiostoma belcheri]